MAADPYLDPAPADREPAPADREPAPADREPAPAGRKTRQIGSKFDPPLPLGLQIAELAASQHGVVTLDQLRRLGLTGNAVTKRTASARFHRVHAGVYALTAPRLLSAQGRRMAAVLACGPGAVLSHQPAAALHGLIPFNGAKIDVTVPRRGGHARAQIVIHRSSTLRPTDITKVDAIPTTNLARTLVDLADVMSAQRLRRAIDRTVTLRSFDLDAVHEQLSHNHARLQAVAGLSKALAVYTASAAPTWNELEERFLALVSDAQLPAPEVQPHLDLRDGEPLIQPDFLWRQQKLIVEVDGWRFHGGREDFERDRRRDQRATAAGYRNVRFTWRQLTAEPARVVWTLVSACAA